MKLRNLQLAGNFQRMDDHRIPKRIFEGRTEERRPVAKPRNKWTDFADEDSASQLRFRNWRTRLMDRDGWRKEILKAKT